MATDNEGFISFHPKKEPVAWITVTIVLLQILVGYLTHNLDTSLYDSLVTALGGAGIRQTVWSPQSHDKAINSVVQSMASLLTKRSKGLTANTTITENGKEYKVVPPSELSNGDELDSVVEDGH